jgi:pimeloyl-ACP methyl ester carboxylesterase
MSRPSSGGAAARFASKPHPVLALGGDGFLGPIVKQGMEALASDVQGGIIKNCGHWVADEQPDEIVRQLSAFLGKSGALLRD